MFGNKLRPNKNRHKITHLRPSAPANDNFFQIIFSSELYLLLKWAISGWSFSRHYRTRFLEFFQFIVNLYLCYWLEMMYWVLFGRTQRLNAGFGRIYT